MIAGRGNPWGRFTLESTGVLDSTSDELWRRVGRGEARDGLALLAEAQTAGRGRLGRTWASPRGNLHLSLLRRVTEPPELAAAITLVAGVALARAVSASTGLRPGLKWPNDLVVRGRKLAGILTEGAGPWQVIGVGLNATTTLTELPRELHDLATTLRDEAGEAAPEPAVLAGAFLAEFAAGEALFLARGGLDVEAFETFWIDRGRPVRSWQGTEPLDGVATEVTPLGVLRVRDAAGRLHDIRSGELLHRLP
ncbi:MAG: biotin--[acetyl-CoA-carboxylase] ligase [Deltaproteobacteria bacterium]|nr:biotin--[acetyl-CoA-carboxylase] ligase [Deltaproteobacteria bacterium]